MKPKYFTKTGGQITAPALFGNANWPVAGNPPGPSPPRSLWHQISVSFLQLLPQEGEGLLPLCSPSLFIFSRVLNPLGTLGVFITVRVGLPTHFRGFRPDLSQAPSCGLWEAGEQAWRPAKGPCSLCPGLAVEDGARQKSSQRAIVQRWLLRSHKEMDLWSGQVKPEGR